MQKYSCVKSAALATVVAVLSTSAAHAAFITAYSNDFDGTITGSGTPSGVQMTVGVQSLPAPFSGNFLQNYEAGNPAAKTTFTLSGLATHDKLDINFDLAFLDSWDSTNGTVAPDYFNVDVNGVNIFQVTSANASGSITYSGGTGLGSPAGGCNSYGFNGAFCDRAFDVGSDPALTIANNTSTVVIDFYASGAGYQGGADESWGIDNLQVQINTTNNPQPGVPEPGTLFLLGSGLAGVFFGRRRKSS
jgi:hypothetical protein